jgi:DNA topoisomerase-3
MVLKTTKEKKFYVGCKGYPGCKHAIWFPNSTKDATVTKQVCGTCRNRGRVFLIQASFDPTQIPPSSPEHITGCVFCDGPLGQMVSRRGNDVAPQAPVRDNNQQRQQYARQPQQPPQRPQQRQNNSPPHRNQDVLGKRPRPGPVNGGNNTDAPHCNCGLPCRMFTCKQGDNAGTFLSNSNTI